MTWIKCLKQHLVSIQETLPINIKKGFSCVVGLLVLFGVFVFLFNEYWKLILPDANQERENQGSSPVDTHHALLPCSGSDQSVQVAQGRRRHSGISRH